MITIKAEATNSNQAIDLEVWKKQGMVNFFGRFTDGSTARGEMPYYFLWRKWLSKNATLQDEITLFKEHTEILERLYVSYCLMKHEEAEVGTADPEFLLYRENRREIHILHRVEDGLVCVALETYGGKLGKSIHIEATAFFNALKKLLE